MGLALPRARRIVGSEIYLYFDLEDGGRVFHHMGEPEDLCHIAMRNEKVVISPPLRCT